MFRCWWNQIVTFGCSRRISVMAIRVSRSEAGPVPE